MARNPQTGTSQRPADNIHDDALMRDADNSAEMDELLRATRTQSPISPVRDTGPVNVYDADGNTPSTSPTRTSPSAPPSTGGTNIVGWIIGAILLIAVIYFIFQWLL
jgi:hypothetical protein